MLQRFATLALLLSLSIPTHAASQTLSYATLEDASETEALFEIQHLGGESATYRCSLATLQCAEAEEGEDLIPEALEDETFYYLSPRNDLVVVTRFVPDRGPNHTLYTIENNELTNAVQLPLSLDITRVRYSEDGNVLIITQADGSTVHYDRTRGVTKTLTALPSNSSWTTVSPNGRYIAYYIPATQSRAERTFGVVDTTIDRAYTFMEPVAYWDLLTEGTTLFAFSPDSTKLLYLSDRSGFPTLHLVQMSTLATAGIVGRPIITRPYSVSEFTWRNNATVLFTANRESRYDWSLYAYTLETKDLQKVTDNIAYDAAFIKAGNRVIFNRIIGDARIPHIYDLTTGTTAAFSIPGLSVTPGTYQGTSVTAGALQGVWHESASPSQTLLVWLHGGPYRQASEAYHPYFSYAGYDWVLENLTEQGVGVLKLDYPGSAGHGRALAESITGQVGSGDVAQSLAAIRSFAATHGYTEVYLAGNSYGGYLALRLLAEHPDDFEGAFSINGVTDWDVLTRNLVTSIFNVQFGGLRGPANDQLYQDASIIDRVENLEGERIVIAHGTNDRTIPFSQATLLIEALEGADIDAELITFENEDHVYRNQETFEQLCQTVMDFVEAEAGSTCEL